MGKNSRKTSAAGSPPPSAPPEASAAGPEPSGATPPTFRQRHPGAANAIFAALWVYVALICLLALDQTFHWGIWGPQGFALFHPGARGAGP